MRIILALAAMLFINGCLLAPPSNPTGSTEPLPLVRVERSEATMQAFGAAEGITQVYPRLARFEDRLLRVAVNPTAQGIGATITNRSAATIRILWDRTAIIGPDGTSSGVIHSGVRMINADQPLPPTVIPAGATAEERIVPARNVSFRDGEWRTAPIFGPGDVGREMSLLLTLEVAGEPHEYRLSFGIGGGTP